MMDTPQSNALLKKLIAAVERVGHYLEIFRQDFNRQSNAIRTAQERSKDQRDVEPVWLKPILAKYDQSEGNREKKDSSQYRVQNSLRWATWFTFGAVVVYAGITLLIYKANKKAADAARDAANSTAESVRLTRANAHLDQRAWLAVEDIPGTAKVGDFFYAVVHVKNSGKTPAINERFSIALNNTLPKVDTADVALECIQANAKPERTIVAPGGTASFPGRGEEWGKLNAAKLGTKKISIYGCVLYDDIFRESHWLTFCGYWKDDIKAFDNCEVGDATGDGNGPTQ